MALDDDNQREGSDVEGDVEDAGTDGESVRSRIVTTAPERGRAATVSVRLLLILGIVFVVVGLSLLILTGSSNLQTSGGLTLWGLLLLVVYAFFEPETVRGFFGQGGLQAGTRALLTVLLVLAAMVLLNVIVRDRLGDIQLDVTKNRVNSLAPQTQTVLKGLDKNVTATVWYGQSASEMQSSIDLLNQFHRTNNRLLVKQKSVIDDPATARALGLQQDSVEFDYPGRQPQVTTDATEAGFVTSLIRLSTGRSPKVYFLTGHGEGTISAQSQTANSYTQLKASLDKQGINTAELNLLTGTGPGSGATPAAEPSASPSAAASAAPSPEVSPSQVTTTAVPSDADEVVILDPNANLTAAELTAVGKYLDGGGHVFLSIEPFANTNANDLVKKYGISIGAGIVLDPTLQYNQVANPGVLVIQKYGSHVATRGLDTSPSVIAQMSSVDGQAATNYSLTPLMSTSANACERTDRNNTVGTCQGGDKKGPFTLMAALEQTNAKTNTRPTRIIAMGGAAFVSDSLVSQLSFPGNMPLMDNAVNWLAGQDKIIDVPVRTSQPNSIFLTDFQHQLILIGYPFLLPLLLGALGVVVYVRRR